FGVLRTERAPPNDSARAVRLALSASTNRSPDLIRFVIADTPISGAVHFRGIQRSHSHAPPYSRSPPCLTFLSLHFFQQPILACPREILPPRAQIGLLPRDLGATRLMLSLQRDQTLEFSNLAHATRLSPAPLRSLLIPQRQQSAVSCGPVGSRIP